MRLRELHIHDTRVSDLSALTGLPLRKLVVHNTDVTDLTPLRGMRLGELYIQDTRVSDLSALTGLPLRKLDVHSTHVTDLTPLRGMRLELIVFSPDKITKGIEALRKMETLGSISVGDYEGAVLKCVRPEEFWTAYDVMHGKGPKVDTDVDVDLLE